MMNDPKYQFGTDDGIWHREGRYWVERDEPCMLLRAKDVTALAAICAYIEALGNMPVHPSVDAHLSSSIERLHAFLSYQEQNPELQSVGCNRRSHATAPEILETARGFARCWPEGWPG